MSLQLNWETLPRAADACAAASRHIRKPKALPAPRGRFHPPQSHAVLRRSLRLFQAVTRGQPLLGFGGILSSTVANVMIHYAANLLGVGRSAASPLDVRKGFAFPSPFNKRFLLRLHLSTSIEAEPL